ncbi:MAG TPA: choice-of-anchor tandem repeat GloVer-containing protein [Candidatus Cybelea sp.]
MGTLARIRRALCIGAVAALLAGCGSSQLPIRAPSAMPQASVLAVRASNTKYKIVYSFRGDQDAANPAASLIKAEGILYGTTASGGATGGRSCFGSPYCGTVFSITLKGREKVLHSFGNGGDGVSSFAPLIDVNGVFYGTTSWGGSYGCGTSYYYYGCGTVFSVTPDGTEKVLHSFGNGSDGAEPSASLVDVNGTLYGTTQAGGAHGAGTVFSITRSGTENVVYTFSEPDGVSPSASLIEVNGKLYGTTQGGGAYSSGTVFSVTLSGSEKVLHSFGEGTDGAVPEAALINVAGTLYGTTKVGGRPKHCRRICGTVFSITPSGRETVLHAFSGPDGGGPVAPLIEVNGELYGTTQGGGTYSSGTVFRITPSGSEKVLHSFNADGDGEYPYAGLTDVNGTLYGTTYSGGNYGAGTVFSLTLESRAREAASR